MACLMMYDNIAVKSLAWWCLNKRKIHSMITGVTLIPPESVNKRNQNNLFSAVIDFIRQMEENTL